MYLNTKMTKEARIQLFSFVGCLVLQKYAMGLQSNLSKWEGRQETGRGNSQMKHIFASFGTQRKRRGAAMGTAGTASVFSLLILLAKSGIHTGVSVAVLLILAGQLDVHLKLSIIPNCMLSVMIVQVVQVVYFYFGVFN